MNWTLGYWRYFLKYRYGEWLIYEGENRLHICQHIKDVWIWFVRLEVYVLLDAENDMQPFGVMVGISF